MRSLLRVLGEAAEIRGNLKQRREHLVAGATHLVGATFVATVVDQDFRPGGRGRLTDVAAHGLDGTTTEVLAVLARDGTARHPALRRSMALDDYTDPLVWQRRDRASDREWFRDSYVNDYIRTRHLGDGIYGGVRMADQNLFGVGAMREPGDSAFTDEDAALLEGYAEGALALWRERDSAAELGRSLPPRLKTLLPLLLSGRSEKEIAAELGLAWSSVHTYTRQLYRALGVNSRAQLMARAR